MNTSELSETLTKLMHYVCMTMICMGALGLIVTLVEFQTIDLEIREVKNRLIATFLMIVCGLFMPTVLNSYPLEEGATVTQSLPVMEAGFDPSKPAKSPAANTSKAEPYSNWTIATFVVGALAIGVCAYGWYAGRDVTLRSNERIRDILEESHRVQTRSTPRDLPLSDTPAPEQRLLSVQEQADLQAEVERLRTLTRRNTGIPGELQSTRDLRT